MPQKFEITYPVNIYNRVVELTANNTWKERRFPLSIRHTGVPCTAGCPTIKSGKSVGQPVSGLEKEQINNMTALWKPLISATLIFALLLRRQITQCSHTRIPVWKK